MTYSYFPGCTYHSTGQEYDRSFKAVCAALDIKLKDVNSWTCCGSSSAHSTSKLLSVSLPTQNLSEVEKEGLGEVVVPCVGCYSRFKKSVYELEHDPGLLKDVSEVIDYQFQNKVKVLNPLEIFSNGLREKVKGQVKKDLSKLKIACYYGCVLTRPPKVMKFDQHEYPMSMDNILTDIGADVLDWSYKTECCGVSLSLTRSDIVVRLTVQILENASAVGADALAVSCPLCHANLDTRQEEINKLHNKKYNLPIMYFTQVMGLAFGFGPKELSLNKHFVDPGELLKRL